MVGGVDGDKNICVGQCVVDFIYFQWYFVKLDYVWVQCCWELVVVVFVFGGDVVGLFQYLVVL